MQGAAGTPEIAESSRNSDCGVRARRECRRVRVLIAGFSLISSVAFAAPLQIRVATFNASLNRGTLGRLATDLSTPDNVQAKKIAEIIQRIRPDIILVKEFDYDAANPSLALNRFHDNYLAVAQNGQAALSFAHRYIAPSNTGVPTGATVATDGDFDNNGSVTTTPGSNNYGNDCFSFGVFPGQYSFAVYSRFPIDTAAIRSFQRFKWKDMPGHVMPPGFYTASEQGIFRLSSKNHVDLPIEVAPGHTLHLLASHPTPPAFDGAEDRNGRRNHDEIRLWADYIANAQYLYDDAGVAGGLADEQRFIILGDLNADPLDGDSYAAAVNQLRNHPLINAVPNPSSPGGTQQAQLQGGVNASHKGNPAFDTSDFNDFNAGNLRVDHVLPSKLGFAITGSGVFWPLTSDPAYSALFTSGTTQATDHRLVWLDLTVLPIPRQAAREFKAARANENVVLTWRTQTGVTYRVEQSTGLSAWAPAPEVAITIDPANGTATATGPDAFGIPQRFYRLALSLEASSPALSKRARGRIVYRQH